MTFLEDLEADCPRWKAIEDLIDIEEAKAQAEGTPDADA